jgi:molybdenum cofactor cytidylyltransferase
VLTPERCALVLLAAGRATRFGGDKLAAPLSGRPLLLHAVAALAALPFGWRVAVVAAGAPDLAGAGYRHVLNPDPAAGMAGSLRLGVAAAQAAGAAGILVALGDMPRVTPAHVRALFAASGAGDSCVASSDGVRAQPPALFGAGWFAQLAALDGDRGARDLLAAARLVRAGPGELADVDTPADLHALGG